MRDRVLGRKATRRWWQTFKKKGEHVEPSAVAGEEPDRDQEDLHGDEEAPARNVGNPKDPLPEERYLHHKRGHSPYRRWCPVCVKAEPALVQVQDRIISVRTQPTIPENPPAYDPQANGGAERGVQEVKGQLRATKLRIGGQSWRGNHGYHGHFGVDDPAGC